jgi:UDP-N-acetylglucosamine transferase subunit ALG13
MILVVMGTEKWPFNRVVHEVDRMAGAGEFNGEEVFVQLGSCTYHPSNCTWKSRISFDDMAQRVSAARIVISHAGAGTFMLCRKAGTPQIMIPRRAERGEHVDDHQVLFAERLAALGMVRAVAEVEHLSRAVSETVRASAVQPTGQTEASPMVSSLRTLARDWGL